MNRRLSIFYVIGMVLLAIMAFRGLAEHPFDANDQDYIERAEQILQTH